MNNIAADRLYSQTPLCQDFQQVADSAAGGGGLFSNLCLIPYPKAVHFTRMP